MIPEPLPQKPAFVMAGSGLTISYGELDRRSRALAVLLRQSGLRPGDTVAIVSENRLEWGEMIWACARSGLDIAPVNFHLGDGEIAVMLEACQARVVISSAACRVAVEAAIAQLGGSAPLVELGAEYEAGLAAVDPDEALERETLGGRVMFSSGTTGAPKAVRHRGAAGPPRDFEPALGEYTTLFGLTPDTVYLSPAPIYHTAPIRFVFAVLQLGGTVVCMERFDARTALQAMADHGVTHAQFVPTMLLRIDRLPAEVKAAVDLSRLQAVMTGAAPCPPELKQRLKDWWGPTLHELYGASEGYGNTHIGPEEAAERPGSVGRALRGIIHITDAEGNELPIGQEGVIWFEGGTQRTPGDAEWRTVGDIGRLDEDGYLYLTGRANQIIVCGGVNIHPMEVENLLSMHPAVADVAVLGNPDEEYGEVVWAYVVPTGPADEGLRVDLIAHCRDRLAHYKCPREVIFVEELPRGDNGKMYTRLLERRHPGGPV